MRLSMPLFLILSALLILSCSRDVVDERAVVPNGNTNAGVHSQSSRAGENLSPGNIRSSAQDCVLFDGKNYIKKNGWLTPSRTDSYIDTSPDQMPGILRTEQGKEIKVTRTHYIYKVPWSYSEDFCFEGSDLDYRKGSIKSDNFTEFRLKGKVFMYFISATTNTSLPANFEPHNDPFMYIIQDRNGDGIFETLKGSEEISVPKWVLK